MSARAIGLLAASLLLLGARVQAQDTTSVRPDTLAALHADTIGTLPIVVDFGAGVGMTTVRTLDAGIATATEGRRRRTPTQLRLVRTPDSLTAELARRLATGERMPRVEATLPGGRGGRTVLLRLLDVQVVSARFLAGGDASSMEQDLLTTRESVAQLSAEREEADRQLTAMESLERRKLSAPLDVQRARSGVEVLTVRLESQRARLAIAERRRAQWSPVEEEVVLSAARSEVETH